MSAALDDADIVPSAYTLEVSSPGLERALRTPEHFAGAVGREVRIKLRPGIEGDRRAGGVLSAADDATVTITGDDGAERILRIDDITQGERPRRLGPAAEAGRRGGQGRTRPFFQQSAVVQHAAFFQHTE